MLVWKPVELKSVTVLQIATQDPTTPIGRLWRDGQIGKGGCRDEIAQNLMGAMNHEAMQLYGSEVGSPNEVCRNAQQGKESTEAVSLALEFLYSGQSSLAKMVTSTKKALKK